MRDDGVRFSSFLLFFFSVFVDSSFWWTISKHLFHLSGLLLFSFNTSLCFRFDMACHGMDMVWWYDMVWNRKLLLPLWLQIFLCGTETMSLRVRNRFAHLSTFFHFWPFLFSGYGAANGALFFCISLLAISFRPNAVSLQVFFCSVSHIIRSGFPFLTCSIGFLFIVDLLIFCYI